MPRMDYEQEVIDHHLNNIRVVLYKSLKLGTRGAVDIGFSDVAPLLEVADSIGIRESIVAQKNALDLKAIYEVASSRKDWIETANEDDYPTIYHRVSGDDLLSFNNDNTQIEWTASHEHLVLSAIHVLANQRINTFSLYEAVLVDESEFQQDDWAILTHLLKGVHYYKYHAPHSAELECTQGIDHIDQASLKLEFLGGGHQQILGDTYHAMFLLLRSASRVAMEDESKLAGAREDLQKASVLLESNTDQQLLSSILAAQAAHERGDVDETLLELRRAKDQFFTIPYLEDNIDQIIEYIGQDETRRAQRDLDDLVSSEGVIVEALGSILASTGIFGEVANSEVGQQYDALWRNTEEVNHTFGPMETMEELLDRGWDLFENKNSE